MEGGYTEEAARNAVRIYRSTILFAHLDKQGILGDVSADEADTDAAIPRGTTGTRAAMDRTNSAPAMSPGTHESRSFSWPAVLMQMEATWKTSETLDHRSRPRAVPMDDPKITQPWAKTRDKKGRTTDMQQDWTKPAAKAIPKEEFLEEE